jgi:thioredoxin 1
VLRVCLRSFLKVDVDDMSEIAADAGIQAMPTFLFVKEEKVVDKIVGADDQKLAAFVKAHS